jgi:hypothetical protein
MPKLNITHLPERLKERLEKLERGEEVAIKDIKALLDEEQIERMEIAWKEQVALRKTHKRPKTIEEANAIGWKTKLEVRIDAYREALEETQNNLVDGIQKLQKQREAKAAKIYLDAYFKAEDGTSKESAGNIALTRAGFIKNNPSVANRNKAVWALEETLERELKKNLSKEEMGQIEILKERKRTLKQKKG